MGSLVNGGEPVAAVLLVDVSGGVDPVSMEHARAPARSFVNGLDGGASASLMAFGTQVTEVQASATDRSALLRGIATLRPGGNTALYDWSSTARSRRSS